MGGNCVWRLIPLLNAPGWVQMAIDSWLLKQHYLGLHPPTLRFYTWSPPAISLGYHQSIYPEHWQYLTYRGVPVELVRRPTGGRAVLHQGDLTYAVVTSGLSGSRIQVYQKICEFLIQGWLRLGVQLRYGAARRGYIHNPNCFGTATGADLVTPDGIKLIGSAQYRRGEAILQHGSIRLEPDAELFTQVFGESFSQVQPFTQRGEILIQTVIEALVSAANSCFSIQLAVQPLSQFEWKGILAELNKDYKLL
jgi:lipoate-protein ligase A